MSMGSSNIVVAVDAELQVLVRRVSKLREIRRLAVELEDARLPRAAAAKPQPARAKQGRTRPPALTAADVIDAARDVLADGSTTVGNILERLGRSRTPRAAAAVEDALEQLGAQQQGRARGGGSLYALPAENDDQPQDGELHAKVRELAQSAVGWSDEEFRYQLRKQCRIDASLAEIKDARLAVNGAATA